MGGPKMVICTNDLEQGPPSDEKHYQLQYEIRTNSISPYHDRVIKPKLQHQPGLESLHQFMDPDAKGFAVDLGRRMTHFDIEVLHFARSGKPNPVIKCFTPDDLERAIAEDKDRTGTLLIAQDISQAMIEALGTRFELEPEFFANHLAGTEFYRMGRQELPGLRAPARAPNLLPNYVRKAPFYTAEYRRPYHIEGGDETVFKLRVTQTNTSRGAIIIHRDLPDVFVSEKISVYKKRGSNIGIVLTDSLLSDVPPSSHIPNPITVVDEDAQNLGTHGRWHQVSSRQELISWFQHLTPVEAKSLFNDHEQLALRPILKLVEMNGVMFLGHARYIMNRVFDAQFPDSIPVFLHISRSLYRCIHEQRKLLCYAQRIASLCGGDDFVEQKEDFGFLAVDIDGMLKALEEDVRFLVGEASIRESKIVGWVSKFAALFLPVSLLATILSISNPGYTRWAVLGGLSVPFVSISVYFTFFWKPAYFNGLRS